MKNNDRWILNREDIAREIDVNPFFRHGLSALVLEDLSDAIAKNIGSDNFVKLLGTDGLKCKILQLGSNKWVSGKIRYVVEFEPDDIEEMKEVQSFIQGKTLASKPEEPLDEIRKLSD
ncbi:MAG: hypothetical protein EAZ61_06675 [Oscillatoriales cyanobacterium]|nr:MAG: hypothetical protein EAZ61_06675 [Oscillatoriales cyanobacterium]